MNGKGSGWGGTEAYILGGGLSSRYGFDKCLAKTAGISFLDRISEVLSARFGEVILVASGSRKWEGAQIPDLYEVRCSMNGIVTALSAGRSDFVFISACDLPFITVEAVDRVYSEAMEGGLTCLGKSEGRIHYGFGCYSTALLPSMREAMESGHYALHRFMNRHPYCTVDLDPRQLLNVNRPSDLPPG